MNKNLSGFHIPVIDNPQSKSNTDSILNHVEYSGSFAKSDLEKERLKKLKKEYFKKHKIINHKAKLTNKQISNTFAARVVITK